jgi:hypothetical protein
VVDGPSSGREILVDGEVAIGREETGVGNLGHDPELSRRHARFRRLDSGGIEVEDLGSTNGTFVNGERIDAPRLLAPGDTIKLGKTKLQFDDPEATVITARPAAAAAAGAVAAPPAPDPVAPPSPPAQPAAVASAAAPPAAPGPGPGPSAGRRRPSPALLIAGVVAIAGIVVAIVALAGGGSKTSGGSATASGSPASTGTPVAATNAAPAAKKTPKRAASSSTKVTPIGSTLKLGEPAVIAYDDASNHKKSTIVITPSPIERGTIEDFKNVQLNAQQKSSTPFYVKVSVRNVGKGDLSGGAPANYIDGVDDRGQAQTSVIFFGDFERCPSVDPKHLRPGESYNTCLTYLIPKGGSLVGMRWVVFDQKTGKSDLNWK